MASLRRIALRLCATVPVADGEAGRRPYRRAVAGDFHRTEINLSQPPLDGGYCAEIPTPLRLRNRPRQRTRCRITICRWRWAWAVIRWSINAPPWPEGLRLILLAPGDKERKGEHTKTLENLASQGYIRARIDGEVCDLSDPPKLELQKKHTIEVVIDRFKVRDDLAQRLAESFETALELSGGTAIVANMDDEKAEELCFSRQPYRSAATACASWRPRLFYSFNSPAGACTTCDGLGVQQYFDSDRVVQNPELSLAGGAIRGWDRRNFYYFQMLKSLAEHTKFDVRSATSRHPQRQRAESGAVRFR